MSIKINDNFKVQVGNPIDSKYLASTNQPYGDKTDVNTTIVQSQRYVGLTVNINNVEYWYETGVLDGNLVIKDSGIASTGVTAAYNGITKEANAVKLGGTLTGATTFTRDGNDSLLEYGGDYSGAYKAQTLVDAAYVTGLTTTSGIQTASNGLTKEGTNVRLGGTLTGNTDVLTDGNNLTFNLNNNSCFRLYDAGESTYVGEMKAGSGPRVHVTSNGTADLRSVSGAITFDGTNLRLQDFRSGVNEVGLEYSGDYSTNYTARSLVDKAYIDGEINSLTGVTSQAITGATNGLTKTGQSVSLGGTLTEDTLVAVTTGNTLYLMDSGYNHGLYIAPEFLETKINAYDYVDTGNEAAMRLTTGTRPNVIISAYGTTTSEILVEPDLLKMCVETEDVLTLRDTGVVFGSDYSANYNNLSVVDKCYVDTQINGLTGTTSQAITGATNGITKTGQDVKLGGLLTEHTVIDNESTYGLKICNAYDSNVVTFDDQYFSTQYESANGNCYNYYTQDFNNTFVDIGDNTNSFYVYNEDHVCATCAYTCDSVYNSSGNELKFSLNTSSGIVITDDINTKGAEYAGDYEVNFVPRSLVTKAYVTGLTTTSGIQTASNGLVKTGTEVKLGADLDTDTLINLNNGNCLEICDTGLDTSYKFDVLGVDLNSKGSSFEISNVGDDYTLTHCSGSLVGLSLSGLTYGGDYESNFCENTLVTKAYVDSATGGIDANNGLSRQGSNIVLGGDLTGTTTISSGTHDECLLITAPFCATDVHVLDFDSTPSISGHEEGRLYYNNCALNFDREVSGVTLQIGEEEVIRVTNVTGQPIPNGTVVYVNGASGGLPSVDLADSTGFVSATQTVGITTHEIDDTNEGYITVVGTVHDVNTNGFVAGTLLWLNTGGTYSDVRPSYPDFSVSIGMVTKAGAGDGEIYVRLLYVPNYTEYGLFTGYTASTLTTLNEKLDISDFNTYTGDTETRIAANEIVTAIAITGATNGLCASNGRDATLGGDLTQATTISGAQVFTVGTANNICLVTTTTKDIGLNAKSNGELYLKSQQDSVDGSDMTNAVGIALDYNESAAMLVTDNKPIPRGLQYAADYTASYCDRSLVDKFYVDSIATGLNVHASVAAATTVADGNQDLSGNTTTIDGVNVSDLIALSGQWNRILVKNQTEAKFNGIYSATTGDWGRTSDYDFAPSGEVSNGDLIPVGSGDTLANSQWINVSVNPIVSGDSLNFSVFSQQQGVTGGDGIQVNTVGTNSEVSVDLAASNAGLCISANVLQLDYNAFTCGLDIGTAGEVRVNASLNAATGSEIPVLIGSGNALFVDSDDFSVTLARNGLHKTDAYIALGGALTGATTITGGGGSSLSFDTLSDFGVGFNNTAIITDNGGSPHGICYAADYRSGFVDLSLVDKYFVNNAITGSTLTFTNGLTKVNDTICWGSTTPMTADAGLLRDTTRLCVKETGLEIKVDCSCVYTTKTTIDSRTCNTGGCDSSISLTDTGTMSLVSTNATQGLTITSAAHGAVYAGDYEANFVARSLATAQYVTGLTTTSGIQTASDGLTKTGTNVAMGGIVNSNISIDLSGTTRFQIYDANNYFDNLTFRDTCFVVYHDTAAGQNAIYSFPDLSTPYMQFISNNSGGGTDGTQIKMCSTGSLGILANQFLVSQNGNGSNFAGIRYGGDYEADFVARSLVTKQYVTGLTTTSGVQTVSNGLTKTGTDVALGGILNGDTTISGASQTLSLGSSDSPIGIFCTSTNLGTRISNNVVGDKIIVLNNTSVVLEAETTTSSARADLSQADGLKLTFSGTSNAAYYDDDYSANFVARSLVDAAWVTGQTSTSGVQTVSNGLTKTGTNVTLGGTLTSNAAITSNNGTATFDVNLSDVAGDTWGNLLVTNTQAYLSAGNETVSGFYADVLAFTDPTYARSLLLAYNDSNNCMGFDMQTNVGMKITDDIFSKGLEYVADYSGNFDNCSLITKEYVDDAITGATNTFENGLTETTGVVKLGGTLGSATTIDTSTNNLYISGATDLVLDIGATAITMGTINYGGDNYFAYDAANCWTGTYQYDGTNDTEFDVYGCGESHLKSQKDNVTGILEINGTSSGNYGVCLATRLGNNCINYINIESGSTTLGSELSGFAGAEYAGDYSANYTARSLVDKAYVTGQTGAINANNGLSREGDNIVLGGTLTGATTINTATNNLIVSGNTGLVLDVNSTDISLGDYNGDGYHTISVDNTISDMYQSNGTAYSEVGVYQTGCATLNAATSGIAMGVDLNYPSGSKEIKLHTSTGGTNSCITVAADGIGIISTTSIDLTSSVCITGAMDTSSTLGVGGTLTLDTVGAGDVGTDDVLLITSGGVVTKVSADTLGEDNNIYSKTTYTASQLLTTSSTYVILVNHSIPVTITLPAAPTDGQAFKIKDASSAGALTNNITIARNGKNIDRSASDALINTDGGALELVYDASLGWFSLAFVN